MGQVGQVAFWDYFRQAFQRNRGIRIDHFLLSPTLADRLEGCEIDKGPRAQEKPYDHTPINRDAPLDGAVTLARLPKLAIQRESAPYFFAILDSALVSTVLPPKSVGANAICYCVGGGIRVNAR